MVCTVIKIGDSLAVVLPDEAVEQLNLGEGSQIDVAVDGKAGALHLAHPDPATAGIDAEFARQLDAFMAHYRPALLALAR
jgi:antitoxin component of MazEF toxin-antitoxin module